jgi:hypothetical protein
MNGDVKRKLSDQGRSLLMASMQLQKQAAAAGGGGGASFEATTVTLRRVEGQGLGLLMDRCVPVPRAHDPPLAAARAPRPCASPAAATIAAAAAHAASPVRCR